MRYLPVLLSLFLLSTVHLAHAQDDFIGTCAVDVEEEGAAIQLQSSSTPDAVLRFPNHGRVNALVIFVQHQNAEYEHCARFDGYDANGMPITPGEIETPSGDTIKFHYDEYCANRPGAPDDGTTIGSFQSWTDDPVTEWPAEWSADGSLPSWAEGTKFLALPGTAPDDYEEGSLSDMYYRVSGGRFRLEGHVYPSVYEPAQEADWYNPHASPFPNGAVRLSHEILSSQNVQDYVRDFPSSVFDRYDNGTNTYTDADGDGEPDGDGVFDMIILVYRSSKLSTLRCGPSSCDGSAITSLGTSHSSSTYDAFENDPLTLGGLDVIDNTSSGSGVIVRGYTKRKVVETTAHEIGHRHFGLYHSHGGNNPPRPVSRNSDYLSIMSYVNGPLFSAPDRIKIGWADVETVDLDDAPVTDLTLPDVMDPPNRILRIQRGGPAEGDLIVEARMRTDWWNRLPDGTNQDFDQDTYSPQEGLYLYKVPPASSYRQLYSSLENTGLAKRQQFFVPTYDAAFSAEERDALTPLSLFQFNFHDNPAIDDRVAITDIQRSGSGFSFKIWSDYLTNGDESGTKELHTNYSFDDTETLAQNSTWDIAGTLQLGSTIPSTITAGTSVNLATGTRLEIMPGGRLVVEENATVNVGSNGIVWAHEGTDVFIDEGATFNMGASSYLLVYDGHLTVRGTSSNPVTFQRSTPEHWAMFYTWGSNANGSSIDHAIIDGADRLIFSIVDNISIRNTTVSNTRRNGISAWSTSGLSLYDVSVTNAGGSGVHLYNSSGTMRHSTVTGSENGLYLRYGNIGPLGQFGYNVVTNNRHSGIRTSAASVDLGGGYPGYNSIHSNGSPTTDVLAYQESDIMAQGNWWGESPPNAMHFQLYDNSTLDYQSALSGPPSGVNDTPIAAVSGGQNEDNSTQALARTSRGNGDVEGLARTEELRTGAFVRHVHQYRATRGRAASAAALARVAGAEGHPHRRLAQIFRLSDLLHVGKAKAVTKAGEALLKGPAVTREERELLGTLLFQAYLYEQDSFAARGVLDRMSRWDVEEDHIASMAALLDAEMARTSLAQRAGGARAGYLQVSQRAGAAPAEFSAEAYPNPFNPRTTIRYTLPEETEVRLVVYDVLGREVAVLADGVQEAGVHEAAFDATHRATGLYVYRLQAGNAVRTGKLLLVK